MNGVKMRVNES